MKYAVYWQPTDDIEISFFKLKQEALDKIDELIKQQEERECEQEKNLFWDITLLEVKGEVERIPFEDGNLVLKNK